MLRVIQNTFSEEHLEALWLRAKRKGQQVAENCYRPEQAWQRERKAFEVALREFRLMTEP